MINLIPRGECMEISILYSKDRAGHIKTATLVKKAVKNLGISARITEQETGMSIPRILVDGFDLLGENNGRTPKKQIDFSYDLIEKALERSAWTG